MELSCQSPTQVTACALPDNLQPFNLTTQVTAFTLPNNLQLCHNFQLSTFLPTFNPLTAVRHDWNTR
jgi:hypothetical protein